MFFDQYRPMQHKRKVIAGTVVLAILTLIFLSLLSPVSSRKTSPTFSVDMDENIRRAFLEVWQEYHSLHNYGFELVQSELSSSTMRAQPVIDLSNLFRENRSYRLEVAEKILDSGDLYLSDLPDEVLRGWFAHELGHFVDYENHSNFGMVTYGIRYLLSDKFKREREHDADSIAIRHGFRSDLIATKRYILENDFISPAYQDQINKYYMSISGAELCPDERKPVLPKVKI